MEELHYDTKPMYKYYMGITVCPYWKMYDGEDRILGASGCITVCKYCHGNDERKQTVLCSYKEENKNV